MKAFFFACCLFIAAQLFAQSHEYTFRVETAAADGAGTVVPFCSLMFDEIPQQSNAQGIIYATLRNVDDPVVIKVADEKEYIILSPDKGLLYLPQNGDAITVIKLHKTNNTEKAVTDYTSAMKRLHLMSTNMDSLRTYNRRSFEAIQKTQDSLLRLVTARYGVSADNLRSAQALLAGRDSSFAPITEGLTAYLNEAKDIRDIFKNMVQVNMNIRASSIVLDSVMTVYNQCYNTLNNTNAGCERAVRAYWQSDATADAYHNVADYALNNVHRTNIIPLNDLLVKNINLYIHSAKKKERQQLKESINATLTAVMPILDNNLGVLDVKVNTFNTRLLWEKGIIPNQ